MVTMNVGLQKRLNAFLFEHLFFFQRNPCKGKDREKDMVTMF